MAAAAIAGNTTLDGNKLVDQGVDIVTKVAKSVSQVDAVTICNMSGKRVTFFSYDKKDIVRMVPNSRILIANNKHQNVSGAGKIFVIYPNDKKKHQFEVHPGKGVVYVYNGPGDCDDRMTHEKFNDWYATVKNKGRNQKSTGGKKQNQPESKGGKKKGGDAKKTKAGSTKAAQKQSKKKGLSKKTKK